MRRGRRGPGRSARLVPALLTLAVLTPLAARSDLIGRWAEDAVPVADSYDGFDTAAAERLRQDQCLMAGVLRLGGPGMYGVAQNALNQTPEQLHTAANQEYWNKTPLSEAYEADRSAADKEGSALYDRVKDWKISGLPTPGGFKSVADFEDPPGLPGDNRKDFFDQTGLGQWTAAQFWKDEDGFYEDPTPQADAETVKAVKELGTPLYGKDPDPTVPGQDWQQATAEHAAWDDLVNWDMEPTGADNARLFLSSGGFARTAPEPGSLEYRIAVEDLKTRFAACGWRTPVDPDKVLGKEVADASAEWQQEIAAQAVQRNQILTANSDATKALAAGAKALGEMLGQSWYADHLTRWQDYWSAGGPGWIGDSPLVLHAHGSSANCLDVESGKKDNGTPVQIYTCNGSAAQQWQIRDGALANVASGKCLDVKSAGTADGTAIQIWTCNQSPAQNWTYNPHATTSLVNAGSGKCLDLKAYTKGQNSRLLTCSTAGVQKFDIVPSGHKGTDSLEYPKTAQFTTAKKGVTDAQAAAKKQLDLLKAQAAAAKKDATDTDTAEQAAYAVADKAGAPRGRALLVGQQKAQVTKASAAALDAMAKAGDTAYAATRAAAGDSATVAARALTQAAESKAAFRTAAAQEANAQAKAAADAAAVQAQTAKAARDTARAKLAETRKAEADAKSAAATAHAKRLAAEAEEATAKAEKATAAQKQAEAAQHRKNAEGYAKTAEEAKGRAETAESTAREKRQAAEQARDGAKAKRDDAWDAESKANAARAKADAKDAYADAHASADDAKDARAAADAADGAADDAESAARSARGEANAATQAAADADAAATRAEAAAERARSDSDAAQAAKLKADAAVRTATSSAADAIKASQDAATAARTAVQLADEAEKHAADAKKQADASKAEAAKAVSGAADAAGHAHVTAQAAEDARNSAQQVAAPANDAIQLGSPYITTDAAAGLAVLTGQSSKTIAEQQQAVAEAHAQNAQQAAAQAQSTANAATGDAKAAYTIAAEAAGHAADARKSAKEALGYAAEAAQAAADAQTSLANTLEYDRQAGADAAAADKAAGRAEGYAKDARDSADQAALDAEAARTAATEAEQAAKDARAAADRADAEATAAEEAAKDAQKYADSAQQAADEAQRNDANKQVQAGAATGAGGVFSVIDEIKQSGDPERLPDDCSRLPCDLVFKAHFDAVVSFYLCTNPDVPATESGCPAEDTVFLTTQTIKGLTKTVKVSSWQATKDLWKGIFDSVVGDFTGCYHKIKGDGSGSYGDCAWAATWLPLGGPIAKITEAIRGVDAALRTGVGVSDALKALKALDVDARTLADIERTVSVYEDARTACRINSFPGTTDVVLADGSRKPIRDVRLGDRLLAADPATGRNRSEPVTRTFRHTTEDLLDVTLAGGGHLTSTPGHRFYVTGRGWTLASDLRAGDRLRTPDGGTRTVAALPGRDSAAPRTVYDLTVSGLHTFYAVAGDAPVLVHNCNDLIADEGKFPGLAHVLDEHVDPSKAEAVALAAKKSAKAGRDTPNSVFSDGVTAQQVVDYAIAGRAGAIAKWLRGSKQELEWSGTFGAKNSLGTVYYANNTEKAAGNGFYIMLKRAKGHPHGYYVYTAYPK
ncbi:ricin-type beta-trefoil lectin domain protein [Streptomyces sp. PsTaAH-124]|uniref:ricin-type beta-trefoil lectin domain protein n=1 Tax=Streptomyces sp. PsTaAH-124 TaxID=1157638 RepID=UPI0003765BFB|nr:ricin-type beta-trefoil lectin domain protein [Streptomyces sp. PsTaAH-124]